MSADRRHDTDQRVWAAWEMFEEAEPDISTERLIQQVADHCRLDTSRVVEGISRHKTSTKTTQ